MRQQTFRNACGSLLRSGIRRIKNGPMSSPLLAYAVMQIHCRESTRFDDCLRYKVVDSITSQPSALHRRTLRFYVADLMTHTILLNFAWLVSGGTKEVGMKGEAKVRRE